MGRSPVRFLLCFVFVIVAVFSACGQHNLDSLLQVYIRSDEQARIDIYFNVGFNWNSDQGRALVPKMEEQAIALEVSRDTIAAIRVRQLLVDAYEKRGDYRKIVAHNMHLRSVSHLMSQREKTIMYGMLKHGLQRLGRYQEVLLVQEEARSVGIAEADFGQMWRVYMELGMTRKAVNQYRALMVGKLDSLSPFMHSSYLNNLGVAFEKGHNYDSAMYFYTHASELLESLVVSGEVEGTSIEYASFFAALVKGNIGQVYAGMGEYEKAIPLIRQDAEASRNHELPNMMSALLSLADCQQKLDQYPESFSSLLQVDSLLNAGLGAPEHRERCYRLLAKYYTELGQPREATTYYAALTQLTDSMKEVKSEDNMVAAISAYDLQTSREKLRQRELELANERTEAEQRKAQRNQLLGGAGVLFVLAMGGFFVARQQSQRRKLLAGKNKQLAEKNRQIERQAAQIENSLHEKERLLREIHHRIKNNLQIVGGILKLHARRSDSADVKATMEGAQSKLQVIGLIHQQLYQSEGLSRILLQDYFERLSGKLVTALVTSDQFIDVDINCGNAAFGPDTTVPLGLILNEAITNSLKYGLSDMPGGTVSIALSEVGMGSYELRIADNGPGFPEGFNPTDTKSLGTLLINGLSGQLNGHAEFHNDHGAVVRIFFTPEK